jgi:hypothetical protein
MVFSAETGSTWANSQTSFRKLARQILPLLRYCSKVDSALKRRMLYERQAYIISDVVSNAKVKTHVTANERESDKEL